MATVLTQPKQHIIIGMSGGVDSSVAAYLLQKAGHKVQGVFMKNWEAEDTDSYCSAEQDLMDAQAVCDHLGISFHTVNFANEYWQRVFSLFLAEYQAGRTPNPDILCNKEIKFKAFLDYAKNLGADSLATGHYARIVNKQLLKAQDKNKDQSYFLYALNAGQLAYSLFPLGELTKPQVRALAKEIGLPNCDKKDSTGICFIGERKFKPFLENYLNAQPGPMKSVEGELLGEHEGLLFYTIGQRQGLKIGGLRDKALKAWYVVGKDMANNTLIVAQGEHPALYKSTLKVSQVTWINEPATLPLTAGAKTRYRQPDQACTLTESDDGHIHVSFTQPQRAITPGQSIVFYQGERCLGGGVIDS